MATGIHLATTSRHVQALAGKGRGAHKPALVASGFGKDDRTKAIYLTDAGRSLLGAVLVAMREPPQGSEDGPAEASSSSSSLFSRQPIRTYAPKLLQL
jgi:DNA-binding MarR family transcriptional regulator